ncbi:phage/plasmid primase, P4 family [uncultured Brevundimonas sp.]|uniref:DNA primase family protein n=1 Tax=uncultured Brevundimonas sp. TaxID=213418 RepID=UPI00261671FF|nr:phage/plasmid primase, P4 family [uncultured Brevundimonas sp.]
MSADGFHAFAGLAAAPSPDELMWFELNDLGNAKRLIRMAGGVFGDDEAVDLSGARLLYLRDHGWIAFDGVRWNLAHGPSLARKLAHRVAEGLWAQAKAFADHASGKRKAAPAAGVEAAPAGDEGQSEAERREAALDAGPPRKPRKDKPDPGVVDFYEFARSSGNKGRTEAMLGQAESYLLVELEAFDRDPLMFNVRNGTLRFAKVSGGWKLGFRQAHDPADRNTRVMDVDYEPKAEAPAWEQALAKWQPMAPMRDFLRRISGYGITGDTSEQAFFIYQGLGGDGKSTFIGAIRRILGDYAATADVKTFLDTGPRSGSDASSDVARLAGETRMVCTAEPPRGAKLNEAMIKSFTGGAPLPARRLRQEQFEFKPKGKVFLECNTRPVIKGDDEGIWRRVFIVLWEVRVSKADRIKDYDLHLARDEGPGILNWLLAGVGDWLEQGLDPPRRVDEALEDYRKGSSPFGEWLAERVVVDRTARTPASDFYRDYKEWVEKQDSDARVMTQRAFGTALGERQILRDGKDGRGNIMRRGARLKTIAELEDDRQAEARARDDDASDQGDGAGGFFPADDDHDNPFGDGQ